MDKVENSARKTGRDQFLVGCQCEKEGDKSLFSLHSTTQQLVSPPPPSHRQAGATVVDMQVAGRWKSSQMPAHYAKAELAERGQLRGSRMGRRGSKHWRCTTTGHSSLIISR